MAKTKKRSILTRLLSAVTAVSSAAVMLPAIPGLEAAAYEYDPYDSMVITIAGVKVTSQNANDVLGDGVFRVSEYGTVYVNGNCTYSGTVIDMIASEDFSNTLLLEGDSTLTSLNGDAITIKGIFPLREMTITGDHSLVLNAKENCIATKTGTRKEVFMI